jgi:hypothetical protein
MSKPQDQEPIVYRVGIVRQDLGFDPLYVLETMDEAEARHERNRLVKEWEESAVNKRPFHLDKLDRSFAPSLIIEIKTDRMAYSEFQRLNSPYERQMREQGTAAFMQQNFTTR